MQQDSWTAGRVDAPFTHRLENGFARQLVAEDRREPARRRTEVCEPRMAVVAVTASDHSENEAAVENIPVKIVVFNNGGYGMVKQWQNLFYGGRLSAVELSSEIPDYPQLAEAMGGVGIKVEHPSEVDPAIEKALSISDTPVLIEVVVDPEEMCFPMVPAGGSNDRIVMGREDL